MKRRSNKVTSKMLSQEGASITYALLLFLVCATVSSVILAAGTAASGRISQSVESDQRYYAVTSAARLLKDIVEGYEVKIVKKTDDSTKEETYLPFYRKKGDNEWDSYPPKDGSPVITMDAAQYYTGELEPSDISPTYTMTVYGEKTLEKTLGVDIIEKIDANSGQITFEIKSTQGLTNNGGTSGSDNGPAFTMAMGFVPKIKQSTRVTKEGDVTSGGNVETVTTSMSWSLKSNGVTSYETSQPESSNVSTASAEPTNPGQSGQSGSNP